MILSSKNPYQKNIESVENPEFWENFSSVSSTILELLKIPNPVPENFGVLDPSKIKITDSLFVSLFLYHISENPSIKNETISNLPKTKKQYSFSEHILHYIITFHAEKHTLGMNAMEKVLGIIYSNPEIQVSDLIKEAHVRINFRDSAVDIWNKLFSSTPYRPSILVTVRGSGVMYLNPEVKRSMDLNFYDSKK